MTPGSDASVLDPPGAVDVQGGTVAAQLKPWQRSWFWCAPGEIPTLGWIIFIHAAAVAGLVLLPFPGWTALAIAGALLLLGGLGTTVCYHRCLAHRAVKLNVVVEQVLIFFAMLNGSGKPTTWVGVHRFHHASSDRPNDISSPHHGGFWWAHLRWLWQIDLGIAAPYARDLKSFRYQFWGRMQVPMLALSVFGGLLLGGDWLHALAAALWIGPVRLIWALHTQCTVNSICHLGSMDDEHGSGQNVGWLAFAHLGQGENWHGNHHRSAGSARLGHGWQIDVGWWTIKSLALVGLASRIKTTPPPAER